MARGPLGLPRPFAEEFESPLFIIIEIDRPEHQTQFTDPVVDTHNQEKIRSIIRGLREDGLQVRNRGISLAMKPEDSLLFSIEMAVTNLNIQVVNDINREVSSILGYRNMVISTTPASGIERFR